MRRTHHASTATLPAVAVRVHDRVLATMQVICVVTVGLLIAFDAATAWAVLPIALFLSAVLLGERTGDDAVVDGRIGALADHRGGPALGPNRSLWVAVALAVALHGAVLTGLVLVLVAETCSALAIPFAVAFAAFGTLRLHVAAVLAPR